MNDIEFTSKDVITCILSVRQGRGCVYKPFYSLFELTNINTQVTWDQKVECIT